ncbi:hypothetical protein GCM10022225_15030 [Plantactinospora mayteni]|uniref:Rhamnogalacturonan I lyase beta-sheet domain-containing protein n=1 Tax=Plantactinospora mayteni TaxID=566021 RepID=A0ABQ4EFT2_9ACTN|nr:hypothetical protein [Plantactinospora mayteni]GIG93578.1 hypothetical protein Pma05_01510 [Plantactinospora mayteni]
MRSRTRGGRTFAALSRALVAGLSVTVLLVGTPTAVSAQPGGGQHGGGPRLERLDRGLVAVATPDGVFLSWRLLGDEATGRSRTGLTGADFAVYRDGRRIATVTDSTNYLDRSGTATAAYQVAAVLRGRTGARGAAVTPWADGHRDLPLRRPAAGVTPTGEAYTYSASDLSVDVYAPARSTRNVLRAFQGFVVDGPEYLTVFDGATGRELQTVRYKPGRHDDGLMWGDYAMSRIEPANRVDRFLAGVAYLDGRHPSAIFARGYYTRATLVAYRWDGRRLREDWYVDSGWVPMTNPFNDSPHGREGTDPEYGTLTTQGAHSLSVADVDADGKQEIVYGGATIDHDGSLLYSSYGVLPAGSANPGARAKVGHGDAMHVTDIDPARPGLEIFMVHEGATGAPYGYALRDARTGEVIYGGYTGVDTGRGMVGDVVPAEPGLETWATVVGGQPDGPGLRTADGDLLGTVIPGTNQSIRWAADMTTQIVNGAGEVTPSIDDWQRGRLLTADGTRTNNGTKGNPGLVADVLGDWREELLTRTVDSSAIRIYLSTEPTDRKLFTLMHDPQYRVEVARQQTTYNQPSYLSFYLGSDIDWSQVPLPGR